MTKEEQLELFKKWENSSQRNNFDGKIAQYREKTLQ
jgi:hypothetical protein